MPARVTRSRSSLNGPQSEPAVKRENEGAASTPNKRQKTAATKVVKEEEVRQKPQAARAKKPKLDPEEAAKVAAKIGADTKDASLAASPSKGRKANPYSLTPGVSPYPAYPRPTPDECHHVNKLLASVHGAVTAPESIPAPNLESSGCGEVPSVLDALIRTRLSAATNAANSSRAFRGLVEKFGIIKEGVGKGSVDWDKVRRAPVADLFEAIKTGGLADVKSRDIQKILTMVYEETLEREHSKNRQTSKGAKMVLSLDHLHGMSSEDAFQKLVGYPGVGPKTASCVLLFCMQRPSFAVDTHVFRLVSWLGWVPSESAVRRMEKEANSSGDVKTKLPPATRNSAYSHLDVCIPDELKYPLHALFIKHGRTCPSCSAKKDSKVTQAWGDKKCPLIGLKGGKATATVKQDEDDSDIIVKEEA